MSKVIYLVEQFLVAASEAQEFKHMYKIRRNLVTIN